MGYALNTDEAIDAGLRRIILAHLDDVQEILADDNVTPHEKVHETRKSYKKIRAALRLAREPLGERYSPENVFFRDAGRALSDMRDATALLETLDLLEDTYAAQLDEDAFKGVREVLLHKREQLAAEEDLPALLDDQRALVEEGVERVATLTWDDPSFKDLIPGLEKSYRRGRKRMAKARKKNTEHQFHEWRKRVKYHRYHLDIVSVVWPDVLDAYEDRFHDLTDYLGDDHDLAMFFSHLEKYADDIDSERTLETIRALAGERSQTFRKKALKLGKQLYLETPDEMSTRILSYWKMSRV